MPGWRPVELTAFRSCNSGACCAFLALLSVGSSRCGMARCLRPWIMEPPEVERHQATMVSLSPTCREMRRRLGALTWAVFEDVVLDAESSNGGLHAATSARRVAQHLGVTPGTAASAL